MISEAIILAGGKGTRLAEVVSDVPKPMAMVAGKPFLCYILDFLILQNIESVVLSVGYKKASIMDFFGAKYKSIDIKYSIEIKPLGTGGAIKRAMEQVTKEKVLVLNGDSFLKFNLLKMERKFSRSHAQIVLATRQVEDVSRYGEVVLDEFDRISSFKEKNESSVSKGFINGGIYVLPKNFFDVVGISEIRFSFETEVLQQFCAQLHFFGVECEGYFIDIGVPESYQQAQEDFSLGVLPLI